MIGHNPTHGEKLYRFTVILLIYILVDAHCYPWKPFNKTFLPVDDQDYNEQESDLGRGRIQKREVFIVPINILPTFCAAGYVADLKGRCVPIIRTDERAYDWFVIEQMKKILRKEMTFPD